ncbi:MAG: DUF1015 domain-containing protein [Candidatus Lokiarchaeota archaeon]|nr:DUF1015 domain-containing protein [Candidatus Lokiarchaeota archaeon]
MPELISLRCFYYSKAKDPSVLRSLVAPPYDVISEEEKQELKDKNPDNICHVILPETYEGAGLKLQEMIENHTLISNKNRCICIYGIEYIRPKTGEKITRYGFVGLLKLAEIFPSADGIVPHEMTFKKFTKDRLNIIEKTDANFSPIFTIYDGNGSAINIFKKYVNKEPFLKTLDLEGFTHKIWMVSNEEDIKEFQNIIKKHSVIIADGHHRYITCLRHSRNGGCKYIMALFIDFNDPGLIIYTSHRQIHKLPVKNLEDFRNKVKSFFIIDEDIKNLQNLRDLMKANKGKRVFGCYFKNKFIFLKLKKEINIEEFVSGNHSKEWKHLSLPILHDILLKNCLNIKQEDISFIKNEEKGLENVEKGIIDALFMVNPTSLEEIHKITQLGEIMPQKSTYFYPKPLSGLIIHRHTERIE